MSQPDLCFLIGGGNWNKNGALSFVLSLSRSLRRSEQMKVARLSGAARPPVVRSLVAKVNTAWELRCRSCFIMRHYTSRALPLRAAAAGQRARVVSAQRSRWNRGLPIKYNALGVRTQEKSGDPPTPLGTNRLINHVFRHIAVPIKMCCDGWESRKDRLVVIFWRSLIGGLDDGNSPRHR